MIEFRNVNKAYEMAHGKNIVLKDVSFKFPDKNALRAKPLIRLE